MKAKELLAKPEAWTKGAYARDAEGQNVHAEDEEAVSFCLDGALRRCYVACSEAYYQANERILDAIPEGFFTPISFNDFHRTTHADVLALLEKADV